MFVVADREVSVGEIRDYLLTKEMASFKLPDAVFGLQALPLTKIGKVDKKKLIEIGKELQNERF